MIARLAEIRKALAALSGAVAVMIAAGLITGSLAAWITGAVAAALAAITTWAAPANTPHEDTAK